MNVLVRSTRGRRAVSPKMWSQHITALESENQVLRQEVARLHALLDERSTENEQLQEQIEDLKRQLRQDSHNSSRPPSSDGLKKAPVPKNLREKTGRRSGGQPGHTGHTLKMSDTPDEVVDHPVHHCVHCQTSLTSQEPNSVIRRQEWDIPPMRLLVTEHQAHVKRCPVCGTKNTGEFPAHIQAPVQYGARVKALAVYLREAQHLPYERTQQFFVEWFHQPISEATIQSAQEQCQKAIAPVLTEIEQELCQAEVTHHDETGLRVEGKLQWCHVACTPRFTRYMLHAKRGKEGMDALGVLPRRAGKVAVHDYLSSYFRYSDVQHALCNAHILRELKAFAEDEHRPQEFAKQMILLLRVLKARVEQAQNPSQPMPLKSSEMAAFERHYDEVVEMGWQDNPLPEPSGRRKRGRPKKTKVQNLLKRLGEHKAEQLRFVTDWRVAFDNNQAERDLRMVKLQQKVSGSFRTTGGAQQFLDIRSYLSTAHKQGYSMLTAIQLAISGTPWRGG